MNITIAAAEIARIAEDMRAMCGDDETLFSDMLEGETDLHRIIASIHDGMARDSEMIVGIEARASDLAERKARLKKRVEASRAGIVRLMQAGQQRKIELPEATYSIRDGKPSLSVVDPDAVPSEYQRIKADPDKSAINAAFGDADELPNWLTREPAKASLTARTK